MPISHARPPLVLKKSAIPSCLKGFDKQAREVLMQSASAICSKTLLLFCHLKIRIQIKLHGLERVLRVKISKSNFMSYRSKMAVIIQPRADFS
jgi:hypothetical protein